jgi:phosphohistidine phosphatase
MLRLTLIRHATAEPAQQGQEDWDRGLEARGKRDAVQMGLRLKHREFKPQCVLTSPAVRAMTTATLIGKEIGVAAKITADERLYLADPKTLLAVVAERGEAAAHVMVFGHNPGLTEFADQLSSDRSIDNLPTCAVYTLEFDIVRWRDLVWNSGLNADFDYPRKS